MRLAVIVNPPNFTVLDGLRTAGLVNTRTKRSFSSNATAAAAAHQSFLRTAYSIRDIGRQRKRLVASYEASHCWLRNPRRGGGREQK